MSYQTGHYSIEELLALRESPLVTKPELPPQMEQWINQPALERRNLQNAPAHNNPEGESKYRTADPRRSRGDSIVLGPPQMSFASSLHSPPLRKTSGKEPTAPSNRIQGSPPHEDLATSPQDDDEEGWSKVRSSARGNASRTYERRTVRGERRLDRDSIDTAPPRKATAFRNPREGESQNWRSERPEPGEQMRDGRHDEGAEFLEGGDDGFGERGRGDGKEHSAEEFQAWLAKMRGQNKPEDLAEKPTDSAHENGISAEPPKAEKPKIVDVDSLFALDSSTPDDSSSKGPMSTVFFDSLAPTGRASRFRQLFAQDAPPPPVQSKNRPVLDRMTNNPTFTAMNKPSSSVEDREGFQRIMAMLGGGGGGGGSNPGRPASPPLQQPPPLPPMQDHPAQNESKGEFFQRLLRQGQPMGGNPPPFPNQPMTSPPMPSPPMQMVRGSPMDQPRPSDLDTMHHQRMARPPQSQGQQRPQGLDPRYPPYDLPPHPPPPPPPPQGAPWMHPPPGFSPPNARYPFQGPPLSPGMPPPPPPGGFGPPPPGMMPYGGPPPGFGRGGFSPPIPPPGQDGWHPPQGFGGGYYHEADNRE